MRHIVAQMMKSFIGDTNSGAEQEEEMFEDAEILHNSDELGLESTSLRRVVRSEILSTSVSSISASSVRKYYVVREGRCPGIYLTWPECKAQVEGYSGAEHKSFKLWQDAEDYLGCDPIRSISNVYVAGSRLV